MTARLEHRRDPRTGVDIPHRITCDAAGRVIGDEIHYGAATGCHFHARNNGLRLAVDGDLNSGFIPAGGDPPAGDPPCHYCGGSGIDMEAPDTTCQTCGGHGMGDPPRVECDHCGAEMPSPWHTVALADGRTITLCPGCAGLPGLQGGGEQGGGQ